MPDELGERAPRMQKLMLAGNRLQRLPQSLAKCANLELIRIASNALTEFSAFLLDMPSLAYAGNPSFSCLLRFLTFLETNEVFLRQRAPGLLRNLFVPKTGIPTFFTCYFINFIRNNNGILDLRVLYSEKHRDLEIIKTF